jgi:hypothetical protein
VASPDRPQAGGIAALETVIGNSFVTVKACIAIRYKIGKIV